MCDLYSSTGKMDKSPAYTIAANLLLSNGGTQCASILCIAGNVTPYIRTQCTILIIRHIHLAACRIKGLYLGKSFCDSYN